MRFGLIVCVSIILPIHSSFWTSTTLYWKLRGLPHLRGCRLSALFSSTKCVRLCVFVMSTMNGFTRDVHSVRLVYIVSLLGGIV